MVFNEKLTLLIIAYYDCVSDSKIGCNELFQHAQLLKNQFTDEDYTHLTDILEQDNSQIKLTSGTVIQVKQGHVYGLRTKRQPCLIKEVDISTFEMALEFYAASSSNYQDVHTLYDDVQALRLEVQRLQTELGMLTFDIMREDILRYKKIKEQAQIIERARRIARRAERAVIAPKKYCKKRKKTTMSVKKSKKNPGKTNSALSTTR